MAYTRKTVDTWQMWVNYGQGWEHETTEDSRAEAKAQQKCYWENCPQYPTRIKKVREPKPSVWEQHAKAAHYAQPWKQTE